ncbi:N-acetylglucosamine-6-phosphate deacetylase [uncultured Pleomorphomonas sp.]|uniref:N-acetylglucosamine-6-phosphate deacetylase n=1 Tax=uncultured Pleomorphomonas sp. TaxID=442121 RepID=A0A212L045_9HYPH|nr:N-acetylglucosamine-6-phosphate deacetylase [uncultured Pleomorphomonas sp.]SCM70892.1 N-acetylglucosamine-6-phosphate deacetylase [uncultured Pleomorphomonas sp.]
MSALIIRGARLFDGDAWHDDAEIAVEGGRFVAAADAPAGAEAIDAHGLLLVPGFIDLQVNGGGGINFNDGPSVATIERICAAHARFGTTALLPTLITDRREIRTEAIAAGKAARTAGVPGFLGLHLEGPHLSAAKRGVHAAAYVRPMEEPDVRELLGALAGGDPTMLTVAPESTPVEAVRRLAAAGGVVSLGHTDCDYDTALAYIAAGATTATHLFNAMSPLGHRAPGMVGAILDSGISAGLIADGVHVHPAAARVALRAKRGPGRLFLVTDAMLTIGTDLPDFELNGRTIFRRDSRLALADGTLAGADIDMLSSVRYAAEHFEIGLDEAIRMATVYPAEAMRIGNRKGRVAPGFDADFLLLTPGFDLRSTWIGGGKVHSA